jgi:hypothetical protein
MTASTALQPAVPASGPGRNELGLISINDRVVEKMAARAAIEIPDAGAHPRSWAVPWPTPRPSEPGRRASPPR